MRGTGEQRRVWAHVAATAWLNAAIASSQEKERFVLYRTVAVEFFKAGIQLVGCDGTMLFRTWVPYSDAGDLEAAPPAFGAKPRDSVVVMDPDKFVIGFMRTLLSACSADEPAELTFAIEEADQDEEPALGDNLSEYVLVLRAIGQRLTCKLLDDRYPEWRNLKLGVEPAERVDGMTLATKLFTAVGKLKGVNGIQLTFRGEERAIEFSSAHEFGAAVSGMLMPMRRPKEERKQAAPEEEDQLAHAGA